VIFVLTIAKKNRINIASVSEEIMTSVIGISNAIRMLSRKSMNCWMAKIEKIITSYIVS
jgi:hypothetical protein